MTPQQLIGISVRLFAIWMALSSVAYFAAIPSGLSSSGVGENSVYVSYGVGAFYVAAAVVLWLFPMAIAHSLIPRTSHNNRLPVAAFELSRVGIAVLGLWLVAKSVPTLSWIIFRAFLFVNAASAISGLTPELKLEMGVAAVELLIAVVFVLKSSALASFLTWRSTETKE
jgi:hypothetical protein